ncbi:hypothetical protein SALBM311S_06351 [Streptomyces alboniger]
MLDAANTLLALPALPALDAEPVVSELVTNAMWHAPGRMPGDPAVL